MRRPGSANISRKVATSTTIIPVIELGENDADDTDHDEFKMKEDRENIKKLLKDNISVTQMKQIDGKKKLLKKAKEIRKENITNLSKQE